VLKCIKRCCLAPISFPSAIPVAFAFDTPSLADTGAEPFGSFFQRSTDETGHDDAALSVTSHRRSDKVHDKDRDDRDSRKGRDADSTVPTDAPGQQQNDPRIISSKKNSSSGSSGNDSGAAAKPGLKTGAAGQSASSSAAKNPLAFSVNLQKSGSEQQLHGGKQHADADDTGDLLSSVKNNATLEAAPKPQVVTPSLNVVPAAAITTGMTQPQSVYSTAQLSKAAAEAPASEVLETAELPKTPVARSQSIDLKVAGADNSEVDVRVSQRAGDVQVTVRTPDGELAQSLRHHLPELSDRLAQEGIQGDFWHPTTAQTANSGSDTPDSWNRDQSQSQQQQQQHAGNQSNRRQQQESGRPGWLNELNTAEKEGR
jgi:flagellar hook-length control protein FliK